MLFLVFFCNRTLNVNIFSFNDMFAYDIEILVSRAVACICQIFTGGSEFRLAMTDRATIAGLEVAKLVSDV